MRCWRSVLFVLISIIFYHRARIPMLPWSARETAIEIKNKNNVNYQIYESLFAAIILMSFNRMAAGEIVNSNKPDYKANTDDILVTKIYLFKCIVDGNLRAVLMHTEAWIMQVQIALKDAIIFCTSIFIIALSVWLLFNYAFFSVSF